MSLFAPLLRFVLPSGTLTPRLGRLRQHDARPLRLPWSYQNASRSNLPSISISLVTPSYGHAQFIGRTISSVLNQKCSGIEYFVQDGNSQDETVQILTTYQDQLSGWESKPDRGQAEALNRAFERTKGEIMGWINSDDVLLPGALAFVGKYFRRHPRIDVIYGNRILIDEADREIGQWVLPGHDDEVLRWADFVPQETMFWRRSLWERVGQRIDDSFQFAMDWDLLLRFVEAGARFSHVPRFLGAFRVHPRQKTIADIGTLGIEEMSRLRERSLGFVPSEAEIHRAVTPYLRRHVWEHLRVRAARWARLG